METGRMYSWLEYAEKMAREEMERQKQRAIRDEKEDAQEKAQREELKNKKGTKK